AKQNVKVVIINDLTFNAFVMDGRHIFVNAGAFFETKTPNELIGVLAHETGHLAGGHLSRMREQLATAQTQSIIALLAGIGAAVAASKSGGLRRGGIMAGPGAIRRPLLAYPPTQEDQADPAAVKFPNAPGPSPKGMYELFSRMGDDMIFKASRADPYQ